MTLQQDFSDLNLSELHAFIEKYSFCSLISWQPTLQISHIPLILNKHEGKNGTLLGHVSKSNLHWEQFETSSIACIFQGPHSYISPSWYVSKPAVPTWNYAVVKVIGEAKIISDKKERLAILAKTVKYFEPESDLKQLAEIMPENYVEFLADHIVIFKIEIDEIHGKFKLGQNKPLKNQKNIFCHLKKSNNKGAQELAQLMQGMLDNIC